MAGEGTASSLEERRLALEERKAQQDYELRKLELSQKSGNGGWLSRISPLTATVFAGILTLAGTVFAAYWQASSALKQEQAKEQHDLIVKMITGVPQQDAQKNLLWLAHLNLIDPTLAEKISTSSYVPSLPAPGSGANVAGQAFEAVRTDDDAINLVITWEGGFAISDPNNPNSATNGGISLSDLSSYLGRTATLDELKNLSRSNMIDIYKKFYGTPISGVNAPLVRAAYFNLGPWVGTGQAVRTLQTAAGRVLGKSVTADGYLGADSVALINSISDSDLLVETADCIQIGYLKALPVYSKFENGWLERLRTFAPATLHGVCPELQPAPNASAAATPGPASAAPAASDK